MKTALVIGDSHVDTTDAYLKNKKTANFGLILAGKLAAQGFAVTTAGVGGSTVADWLKATVCRSGKCVTPGDLPKSPDLLIVVLGSNDMGKGGNAASVVATLSAADLFLSWAPSGLLAKSKLSCFTFARVANTFSPSLWASS